MEKISLNQLVSVDETGMPIPPTLEQLMDKGIRLLYTRDRSKDKKVYMGEVGLIYQLGDPNSTMKQEGLTDAEIIKKSIEFYDLPSGYNPDVVVLGIAKRYYQQRITPAGVALEALQKAIHNETILISKINDELNSRLNSDLTIDDMNIVINLMKSLNAEAKNIPELTKSINEAIENLQYEREAKSARGGNSVLSSMIEEDV